jgi:hypothetical protein
VRLWTSRQDVDVVGVHEVFVHEHEDMFSKDFCGVGRAIAGSRSLR